MQRRRLETAALAAAFTLVKTLFGYGGMAAGGVSGVRWPWLRARRR